MLKIEQRVSTNGPVSSLIVDHRVCSRDGRLFLCDMDVSGGSRVQEADESSQRPRSLANQVSVIESFQGSAQNEMRRLSRSLRLNLTMLKYT